MSLFNTNVEALTSSGTPAGDAIAYALFLLSSIEEVTGTVNDKQGMQFHIERVSPEASGVEIYGPYDLIPYVRIKEVLVVQEDDKEVLSNHYVIVRQHPYTNFFMVEFLQANHKGAWVSYDPATMADACKDIVKFFHYNIMPEDKVLVPLK